MLFEDVVFDDNSCVTLLYSAVIVLYTLNLLSSNTTSSNTASLNLRKRAPCVVMGEIPVSVKIYVCCTSLCPHSKETPLQHEIVVLVVVIILRLVVIIVEIVVIVMIIIMIMIIVLLCVLFLILIEFCRTAAETPLQPLIWSCSR